jgi:sulfur-oxidizing protein SoxZ
MAGNIKIKAKAEGGETTVRALMTHPMETGLRKDKKTGEVIPAHFITEVTCKWKGKTVMTALWSGGVSQNPYLAYKFKGGAAGDEVEVSWIDNKGATETAVEKIA